jgi:hypothetical protein
MGDEQNKGREPGEPDNASGMEASVIDVRGAGGGVHLVRDLLDKQLVDNRYDPVGRADGVILLVADGSQPRVTCIECGITVSTARLSRRLERWVRAAARRWGLRRGRPTRIPWSKVKKVGIETELDLQADFTPALVWEQWLWEHVVRHIPSLKPRKKQKHGEERRDGGGVKSK